MVLEPFEYHRQNTCHSVTESEVITGKSQTEVCDFPVMTKRTRLISYLLYGLSSAILKKGKSTGSNFQHPLARAMALFVVNTKEVSAC